MEAKTTLARRQDAVQGDFMRKMLTNAGCLLCGILVSRGAVLGSLAPFGASFAAAVPRKYLLSSLLGTAFGYVLLKPSDSFRYLAVVAAIGGLRWLLGDLDKVTKSKVFAPLVAFVPIFATGVSLLFVSTSTLTTFADCVTEAVIAGAAAYFISTALHLAGDNRSFEVFSQQETASVVMSGCILILAFRRISRSAELLQCLSFCSVHATARLRAVQSAEFQQGRFSALHQERTATSAAVLHSEDLWRGFFHSSENWAVRLPL